MIQRIQTLYLILVFLLSGILPFIFPLWEDIYSVEIYAVTDIVITGLFVLSSLLALISILTYKKRQHQFVINRLNIILNVILLGLFLYYLLNVSGESEISVKGIGKLLPLVSIVMLALANKAIQKDERLVKSADRLR